ncbi:polyprenyl synthetase family protein [Fusobacterium sp. PH5-44]|uniref:polyprenyl synthetase family protein n=1 Tax=unclassified Fusobacterium TaxID=2648384 RepID=UPI003D222B08
MELKTYLSRNNEILVKAIENYSNEINYPKVISSGMRYALLNGGKRIRPNLLLMTLDLLGKKIDNGIPTAVAIEMIHTYSLVHDDLPAMDNDDYRRGQLTTHKKYGEANGILIGDSLLTHAFFILTDKNENVISYEKIFKIVRKVSNYAGINGMIGGQTVDIESEGKVIDFETLKYIHANKTGKLLKLPVECGCIIGDASEDEYNVLEKFAELIGVAFQIKDDILDIEGDFEKLGKPVGSDIEQEKSTYPSILGMERSKLLLDDTIKSAKKILIDKFGAEKAKIFCELADYIKDRDR